jgi:hypothetical protein
MRILPIYATKIRVRTSERIANIVEDFDLSLTLFQMRKMASMSMNNMDV